MNSAARSSRSIVLFLVIAGLVWGLKLALAWISVREERSSALVGGAECAGVLVAAKAANFALEVAMATLESSPRADHKSEAGGAVSRPRSGCEWTSSVHVSQADLADEFLMGSVSHSVLMRHVTLNPQDRAPCPEEEKQLVSLVERYNRLVGPLLSAFRDLRTQETVGLIESGALSPYPVTEASDAEIERVAAALVRMGKSKEEAQQLAMGSRHSLQPRHERHVFHQGKYYPMPSPGALPHSVAFYERMKCVILEQMQDVLGWFVANGYVTDAASLSTLYEKVSIRVIE